MAIVHSPASLAQIVAIMRIKALDDDCILGCESRFVLEHGFLSGANGLHYASLTHDLWQTTLGMGSSILFKPEIEVRLESNDGRLAKLGSYHHISLVGHTLWLPTQTIAAWYDEARQCWIDRNNEPWERVQLSIIRM